MAIMRTPRTIDISITSKCNLRCKYCGHFDSSSDVDCDLPAEEWLLFFEELKQCAVLSVTLTGGEPFVRKDFKDIIKGIVKNRMRFSITSNAMLITDDMAKFIASTKRCDNVQVSLDGSTPAVHDLCRGKGSFVKAVEGIKILQKYHIPVSARSTIQKHNVTDIENTARFVLDDLNIQNFRISNAQSRGNYKNNADELQLTVGDFSAAIQAVSELEKKYPERISDSMSSALWGQMIKKQRQNQGNSSNPGRLTACGGVTAKLCVRSDGVIVPCLLLGHIEFGRINKDRIEEIWSENEDLNNYRNMRNICLDSFSYCSGCKYIYCCNGGCPAISYAETGEVYHPSSPFCVKRFLEAGGKVPDVN
ncbi:MAG: SynChlorMet cassette radical SAM/SPASM protein ScmE [Candidatus Electronema sp. V4]|uniref:SynChlorMet cassette radical SAM/SPASM protein ScmE n=1 Tax=Candidatus Electronema sp. V4 TaxID=3454756 RepID=UPI0040554822